MKRGYSKLLYSQRNKNETIVSVIKRLFGEHITSRLVKTQNRELSFRCIAYNIHRLTTSATILSAQIEMCLPRFSFSPMRNVIFYIQVGHRMLKAGPFPLGRLRSIIVTIILFSCCLTHYTYHTPLIIDNFHSKHQHQYSS